MTAQWDVGDIATITLTVDPADETTAATVLVTSPSGVESSPAPTASNGNATWVVLVPVGEADEWTAVWTVTGTGAGVEPHTFTVRPLPPYTPPGRVYATTTDLGGWLASPPSDAPRLLAAASRRIDELLRTAIYDVDDDGMPTHATVIAAVRDAVCAQIVWWRTTGDELGAGGWAEVGIGSVRLKRATPPPGQGAVARYAPDAVEILRGAGPHLILDAVITY